MTATKLLKCEYLQPFPSTPQIQECVFVYWVCVVLTCTASPSLHSRGAPFLQASLHMMTHLELSELYQADLQIDSSATRPSPSSPSHCPSSWPLLEGRTCSWYQAVLAAQAAITKYHGLSGLNNRNLFPHGYGGWKSKIKVSSGFISSEVSLLDWQLATFLLCPHMILSLLCAVYVLISSSCEDATTHMGLGPTQTTSFSPWLPL